MSRLLCVITRRHKWSDDVSPTADFQRIDCLRCGESLDGAKVRDILRVLPPNHWMRHRLPRERES
jgi:hypothetical protein